MKRCFTTALSLALAIVMAFLGVSAWMTWQDMKNCYKVDDTSIPHDMVNETSIPYYNKRGEKLVRENHAACYEAVTCKRKESDKTYKALVSSEIPAGHGSLHDRGQQEKIQKSCRGGVI